MRLLCFAAPPGINSITCISPLVGQGCRTTPMPAAGMSGAACVSTCRERTEPPGVGNEEKEAMLSGAPYTGVWAPVDEGVPDVKDADRMALDNAAWLSGARVNLAW